MYISTPTPTPSPQPIPVSLDWISPLPAPVPMIHQPPVGTDIFEKAATQTMLIAGQSLSGEDVLSYNLYGGDAGIPIFITATATATYNLKSPEYTPSIATTTGYSTSTSNPFAPLQELSKWEMHIQIPLIFIPLLIAICSLVAQLMMLFLGARGNNRRNNKSNRDEENDEPYPRCRLSSDLNGVPYGQYGSMMKGNEGRGDADDELDDKRGH